MNSLITKRQFDLVIIGAGGAGLMAAISAFDHGIKNIAIISKVVPSSSHTVAAKGGINAALGNVNEDDWKWHAYDTLKGGDYLADVDAVEVLCSNAKEAILDLEKMGVVFSRDAFGNLAQRAYGAQTVDFGKGGVAYRACYSKDKTGHTILHTLYQQALKREIKFFNEFFVSDLLMEGQQSCHGCLAVDLSSGELAVFASKMLIIATGGYSQIYKNTTSSLICSGDGSALVLKEGLQLQDMEFVQFHPTGIYNCGFLITEAARGEGGYLLNCDNERFMKKYAPKMMELASRDVISQAMAVEIHDGKGCGDKKDFLYLDLRHISEEILHSKLPGVLELVKNFLKIDVKKDLIPVSPSAHYTMGGIPTNVDARVLNNQNEILGLMAIGEAACVSVHGANRLGCNSLLDLIVFGKIAGKNAQQKNAAFVDIDKLASSKIARFGELFGKNESSKNLAKIKQELQKNNEKNLGVFRDKNLLRQGIARIWELLADFRNYKIANRNLLWNEELIAYFELENLFFNSLAVNFSALNRLESRGAHYRSDYKQRDDEKFLCHSLVNFSDESKNQLEYSTKKVNNSSVIPELNLVLEDRRY